MAWFVAVVCFENDGTSGFRFCGGGLSSLLSCYERPTKLLQDVVPGSSLWFSEMLCVRLSQFVTVCSQGLRLCRAVQCPPSAIARREVRWWREAPRQAQTHQLLKQPFLLPCCPPSACSDTLAWHGYEACDNCCEDRIERYAWRFHVDVRLVPTPL